MSIGQIIGTVIGGALGFFIPGVGHMTGIMIGAAIGGAIGSYLDPVSSGLGKPEVAELDIPKAEEGSVIYDLLGTTKISTANYLYYYNNRNKEVKTKAGKGMGGDDVVTGYKYYLTYALGICLGPVDELYTVFAGDDIEWEGNLVRPASGYSTIQLETMGSITFYFGTSDQPKESTIEEYMDDPTLNTAYRGLCYAFFDDAYIGTYNRAPALSFVLRKTPAIAELPNYNVLQTYDYNPAHAIWYLLNKHAHINTQYLHVGDFQTLAQTLYLEGFGTSLLMNNFAETISYIESELLHIDGILRWGVDAKLHPKLLRQDQEVADLPTITEYDMVEPLQFKRGSWLTTINELKVQHPLRVIFSGEITEDVDKPCSEMGFPVITSPATSSVATYQATASGEALPLTWSIDPAVPNITIDAVTGLVQIGACDDFNLVCTDICLRGDEQLVVVSSGSVTVSGDDAVTKPGGYQYGAAGGLAPYAWSVSGTGVSIDSDGYVTLDDSACGAFTVMATDACGNSDTIDCRVTNAGQWSVISSCDKSVSCSGSAWPAGACSGIGGGVCADDNNRTNEIEGKYRYNEQWDQIFVTEPWDSGVCCNNELRCTGVSCFDASTGCYCVCYISQTEEWVC